MTFKATEIQILRPNYTKNKSKLLSLAANIKLMSYFGDFQVFLANGRCEHSYSKTESPRLRWITARVNNDESQILSTIKI